MHQAFKALEGARRNLNLVNSKTIDLLKEKMDATWDLVSLELDSIDSIAIVDESTIKYRGITGSLRMEEKDGKKFYPNGYPTLMEIFTRANRFPVGSLNTYIALDIMQANAKYVGGYAIGDKALNSPLLAPEEMLREVLKQENISKSFTREELENPLLREVFTVQIERALIMHSLATQLEALNAALVAVDRDTAENILYKIKKSIKEDRAKLEKLRGEEEELLKSCGKKYRDKQEKVLKLRERLEKKELEVKSATSRLSPVKGSPMPMHGNTKLKQAPLSAEEKAKLESELAELENEIISISDAISRLIEFFSEMLESIFPGKSTESNQDKRLSRTKRSLDNREEGQSVAEPDKDCPQKKRLKRESDQGKRPKKRFQEERENAAESDKENRPKKRFQEKPGSSAETNEENQGPKTRLENTSVQRRVDSRMETSAS